MIKSILFIFACWLTQVWAIQLPADWIGEMTLYNESQPFIEGCGEYCDKLIECDVIPEWVFDECVESCAFEPQELVDCVIEVECQEIDWCFEDSWRQRCVDFVAAYWDECLDFDHFDLDEQEMIEGCTDDPEYWECLINCWDETDTCNSWVYCVSVDCDLDDDQADDDGSPDDDEKDGDDQGNEAPSSKDYTGGWRCG